MQVPNVVNKIRPHVTVSCVIFGFDFEAINVLLLEREIYDFETGEVVSKDTKLPGNLVRSNEDLDASAQRLIKELSGEENVYMQQFHTFCTLPEQPRDDDHSARLLESVGKAPRRWVITVGYYALMRINSLSTTEVYAKNVHWYPLGSITHLAYDQRQIMEKAIESMRQQFRTYPIAFDLLPAKFTLTQLQILYEIIFDVQLDKRNFRKKAATMKYLVQLNEKQKGVAHKPARFYRFDREIYEKTAEAEFSF